MTLEAWVFPTEQGTNWRQCHHQGASRWRSLQSLFEHRWRVCLTCMSCVPRRRGADRRARADAAFRSTPGLIWRRLDEARHLRLFVNGMQVGSRRCQERLLTSTGPLRIGGNSIWGEFFQGRIDEIRIYNRALTQAEIQADMNTPINP